MTSHSAARSTSPAARSASRASSNTPSSGEALRESALPRLKSTSGRSGAFAGKRSSAPSKKRAAVANALSDSARSPASQSPLRPIRERRALLSAGFGVLQRGEVVVRERLGVILPAPERLDPGRREQVRRFRSARGDLRRTRRHGRAHGGRSTGAPPRRRSSPDVGRAPSARATEGAPRPSVGRVADGRDRSGQKPRPITAASWRTASRPAAARRVARCDDPLHRLRQRQVASRSCQPPPFGRESRGRRACGRTPRRRAGCPPRARAVLPELGRNERLLEQIADEAPVSASLSGASAIVAAFARAPTPAGARELGPRGAEQDQRRTRRPVGEVVEEVEQPLVRPVKVFEDQHERPPARRAPRRTRRQAANASSRRSPTGASEREQ